MNTVAENRLNSYPVGIWSWRSTRKLSRISGVVHIAYEQNT